MTLSVAERVLVLHRQLVRGERPVPPVQRAGQWVRRHELARQVVVVDDEKIAERREIGEPAGKALIVDLAQPRPFMWPL
jgi:hypothetical protein